MKHQYNIHGMVNTVLNELAAVTQQLRHADALITTRDRLILAARDSGASWADIATALGVTRQAAQNMGQRAQKRLGKRSDPTA